MFVVKTELGYIKNEGVLYSHLMIDEGNYLRSNWEHFHKNFVEVNLTNNLNEARTFYSEKSATLAARRGKVPFEVLEVTINITPTVKE